jgi:hypothetical protein
MSGTVVLYRKQEYLKNSNQKAKINIVKRNKCNSWFWGCLSHRVHSLSLQDNRCICHWMSHCFPLHNVPEYEVGQFDSSVITGF